MTTLPNFFIVGAARAATSSLWFYLGEHPEIFMSPDKEAQFFGFFDTEREHKAKYKTLQEYSALFEGVTNEKIIGEATPTYLALPDSAQSIHKYCPDAKILISLRNPVDRMFSYYEMSISKGKDENITFENWIERNQFWLNSGSYAENIQRYISLFGKDNVKVILYDDVESNPQDVIAQIHKFLDVTIVRPKDRPFVYNKGGKPKTLLAKYLYLITTNKFINKIVRPIVPVKVKKIIHDLRSRSMKKGKMAASTKINLIRHFSEDIKKTSKIIDRDLTHWLSS